MEGQRNMDKKVEKGISDLVGALSDPIIAFPGGWGEDIPEWLKNAITLERLVENMKALKGEEPTGTDSEACAYLMTVSLTQPIDRDWTEIYLYVANRAFKKWGKGQMPQDIAIDSIDKEQERELARLKAWLYRTRTRARQDSDRANRRQAKAEAASNAPKQMAMFEF